MSFEAASLRLDFERGQHVLDVARAQEHATVGLLCDLELQIEHEVSVGVPGPERLVVLGDEHAVCEGPDASPLTQREQDQASEPLATEKPVETDEGQRGEQREREATAVRHSYVHGNLIGVITVDAVPVPELEGAALRRRTREARAEQNMTGSDLADQGTVRRGKSILSP